MTEQLPNSNLDKFLAEERDLPPPRTSEFARSAMVLLDISAGSRVLIEQPRLGMTISKLEGLYNEVAHIIVQRLEANPDRYEQRNSLIRFAHEIMRDTGWSRPDVETAMRQAAPLLGTYVIDVGAMRLRPRAQDM